MGDTSIEWTERSWNPIVGCSLASPGCTNCYAMRQAARIERMGGAPHYAGLTRATKAGAVWTGRMAQAPDHVLLEPLRRRKPTTWFVNSMGDLFHEDVPDEWIDRVFDTIGRSPWHTFQILTKRSARMRDYVNGVDAEKWRAYWRERIVYREGIPNLGIAPGEPSWPLLNVWLGVSAEDQRRADERIPDLLATPAAVRFVSAEPLLGPIDFTYLRADSILTLNALTGLHADCEGAVEGVIDNPDPKLDWIIVGGESGPGARPMHPDWARQIRDQCAAAGTAFFFKQWGEWRPDDVRGVGVDRMAWLRNDGRVEPWSHASEPDTPETERRRWRAIARVGKKRAGRLLDGALHNAMPELRR